MKIKFGLHLKVWIHYPNGKKRKVIDRQSKSYLLAFIDNIAGTFKNSAYTIPDTSNIGRSHYLNNSVDAAVGNDLYGIVIGTGLTDVLPSNYALSSKIANGLSEGQMIYQKNMRDTINTGVSTKRSFEIYRYFLNPTDLRQIVRECGLYVKPTGVSYYLCFVRDLLGAVEVPSKGGISILYKPEISL